MTFPAVTATTSPLSVLPQFVDVLGRKIDKISLEQDWGSLSFYFVENLQHMIVWKAFLDRILPQSTEAGPACEGQHHCVPGVSKLYHMANVSLFKQNDLSQH